MKPFSTNNSAVCILILLAAFGLWHFDQRAAAQKRVQRESKRTADAAAATQPARDYPVKPVPFTAVHFNDVFWAPRIEVNRTVSIPFAFEKCEETGRVNNFLQAAAVLRGAPLPEKKIPPYPFDDTDLYKVIEGASYALTVKPDPKLEAYLDGLIEKIAAAQEPDGYLYPARTIDPANPHRWAGKQRWELERDDSHELYSRDCALPSHLETFVARGRLEMGAVARSDLWPRQAGHLARSSDHRNGARQALSCFRRNTLSQPGQVHARCARARRLARRGAQLQPIP
jgi:DUF1680 family protein